MRTTENTRNLRGRAVARPGDPYAVTLATLYVGDQAGRVADDLDALRDVLAGAVPSTLKVVHAVGVATTTRLAAIDARLDRLTAAVDRIAEALEAMTTVRAVTGEGEPLRAVEVVAELHAPGDGRVVPAAFRPAPEDRAEPARTCPDCGEGVGSWEGWTCPECGYMLAPHER